ncbi:V-type ATP synthase subunit E [Marinilabilia salmonicolor]|jgi:V/A-type H+-transporting ATPase subunit E|uniref:V/A-type H+-transporting ATPase subunit E n=1 Tax=Marinilabilia salmonicolor TaxID=989 RepID=A0A2T0WXT5_9BACT|nr:V-type ATP synthase subunit E [Marinilabilia salmonicolor]PRY91404.1 V/A-type H+-transporting ATPase subunit E [Marinilabilia salmonicolor]RCW37506.1 V/A-type H+-transporting ATPase subunit E [Marinilabilia salmonicolor]
MTKKLQDLTEKIYNEGVQKANEEAEAILKEAREKASAIEKEAKKKAGQTIEDAEKKAEEIKKHVESEMKMALEQSMAALKQDIAGLVTMEAVEPSTKELFSDKKYLGNLIEKTIDGWIKKESMDLEVILPESQRKEMEDHFKKQLANHLNKGLQLSFSKNMKSGFKVGPADGSYVISFTDEDFNNFFKAYLRPKSTELLFEKK